MQDSEKPDNPKENQNNTTSSESSVSTETISTQTAATKTTDTDIPTKESAPSVNKDPIESVPETPTVSSASPDITVTATTETTAASDSAITSAPEQSQTPDAALRSKTTEAQKKPTTSTHKKAPPPPSNESGLSQNKSGRAIQNLILIILIVALSGIAVWSYQQNTLLTEQVTALKQSQARTAIANSDHQSELQSLLNKQSDGLKAFAKLASETNQQKKQVIYLSEQLASLTGVRRQDWEIARLEYLLKLASQRLQLDGDLEGARSTLLAADEYLQQLDNPQLMDVRKQVANDLATLNQAKRIDRNGIYIAIDSLIQQIPSLQPTQPEFESTHSDVTDNALSFAQWLSQKLQGLVRLTANDVKPKASWLSEDAKTQFNAMLTIRLLHAQQALMAEDQVIYDTALKQAKILVETLYLGRTNSQQFINQITELEGNTVSTANIDITGSHQALKVYLDHVQAAIRESIIRTMIQSKPKPATSKTIPANTVKGS